MRIQELITFQRFKDEIVAAIRLEVSRRASNADATRSEEEYRLLVGKQGSDLKSETASFFHWDAWLDDVEHCLGDDAPALLKQAKQKSQISDAARFKKYFNLMVAYHYRMHADPSYAKYAAAIDAKVFKNPDGTPERLQKKKTRPVFEEIEQRKTGNHHRLWPSRKSTGVRFTHDVSYDGPILPTPSTTEKWSSVVSNVLKKNMSAMGIGTERKDYEAPLDIAWSGSTKIAALGGERNIYVADFSIGYALREVVAPMFAKWRPMRLSNVRNPFDGSVRLWVATNLQTLDDGWKELEPKRSEKFSKNEPVHLAHHFLSGKIFEAGVVVSDRSKKSLFISQSAENRNDPYFLCRVRSDSDVIREWRTSSKEAPNRDTRVRFSPSGRFISFDKVTTYKVIDIEAEKVGPPQWFSKLREILPFRPMLFCWHPMEDWFATTHNKGGNHCLSIVDAQSGAVIHSEKLDRTSNSSAIEWSPDGRFLAIAGEDQSIILRDFSKDTSSRFLGHKLAVTKLFFSPDSQRLLSVQEPFGYSGNNVKIWGTETEGKSIFSATLNMVFVQGSPWSPDGRKFIGNNLDQSLEVFELQYE